ncbi:hypothetical protein B0I37DRAFT_374303 [Chaetomium sp. MPI-CAGE-AT-0009]|nr:hypothetical protein B0I37DRAFT_374303 [Chaetomium sp. MPI-CAGE-AT-0009]
MAEETHMYNELLSSFDKLFKEGTYSDLTITCGVDEYKVHKAIVCPRSSFFATACNGLFQEGKTGVVALPDDDPQVVNLMIRYLYYLDYPAQPEVQDEAVETPQESKSADCSNLTVHARVYALGEKYDIQGLKTLAIEKFKTEAKVHWNCDEFIRAVEEVYTSTIDQDRGLRDAVVEAIRVHPTVLDKEPMQNVVRRLDLCFDLMMRFRDELSHYETPQTGTDPVVDELAVDEAFYYD